VDTIMAHRERRASARQQKVLRVLVVDPADALEEPYRGWVVDRSQGGICLSFPRSDIEAGSVLKVQPLSTMAGLPWVEVRVKHRRQKRSRVEFGCEFVQGQQWRQLLLVG
jgi:hypothetical protein